MLILRQSTSIDIRMGPFVDSTDGVSPETTVTLGAADQAEVLKANGAATSAMAGTFAAVTGADGWYDYTCAAGDVDTVGEVVFVVQDSSVCLPVFSRGYVVEEAVYDALYAASATGPLQSTVAGRTLDVTATGAAGIDWGNVENPSTSVDLSATAINLCDTVTTNTDMRGTDSAALASNYTAARAGYLDNINGHTAQTGDSFARLGAPAGASVSADIATIDTNVDAIKAKTDSLTFTVANQVDANAIAISGDTTAADNLESMYDGTGYTDGSAPATQTQIGNLASGSAAISTAASSYTLTTGTQSSGTITDAETKDGTRHEHTDTAGVMDLYYEFDIGGNGVGVEVDIFGYLNGGNDSLTIQAYDWDGTAWDTIGTMIGTNGSTDAEIKDSIQTKHTGTGANLGLVRIRFYAASGLTSATLRIDRIILEYAVVSQSVGYDGGQVWIDTTASNTSTESFVDGVADNPVSTIAAANTVAGNVGLHQFYVEPGSSITFAATQTNEVFNGKQWTLALGGQDIGGSRIVGASSGVSGTATGTNPFFYECAIGAVTVPPCAMQTCGLSSTVTVGSAGDFFLIDCFSQVAGPGSPTIDMGAAVGSTNLSIRRWAGGITINNLAAGDVVSLDGNFGTITLNGADATVEIRGIAKGLTNNLTGSPTVNDDSVKADSVEAILVDTGTTLPAQITTAQNDLDTITGADGATLATTQGAITWDAQTISVTGATDNITLAGSGSGDCLAFTRSGSGVLMDTAWAAEFNAEANSACDTAISDASLATASALATVDTNVDTMVAGIITGTASGTPTATTMDTDLNGYANDELISRVVVFTGGTAEGQVARITDYASTNGVVTMTTLITAPVSGDTFKIV